MNDKPKASKKTAVLTSLAAVVLLGGAVSVYAFADDTGSRKAGDAKLVNTKVSLSDAIRIAEATGAGVVVGAEFDAASTGAAFEVTTQNGAKETDHRIDSATGTILSSTPDEDSSDGSSEDANEEVAELAALSTANVSLLEAIAAGERSGSRVLSAEYEFEDGKIGVEMTAADKAGVVSELMLDAQTGVMSSDDEEHDRFDTDAGEPEGRDDNDG